MPSVVFKLNMFVYLENLTIENSFNSINKSACAAGNKNDKAPLW